MIMPMLFEELSLQGAWLIKPFCATDERGSFIKDYSEEQFAKYGICHGIKEVFYAFSKKGVIRGLHFQLERQQAKLVRCISGHIYDVIVDLRPESITFGKWCGFHLTGENMHELLIPERFGHGYLVLDDAVVSYKCNEDFFSGGDSGIAFDDPQLGIDWPLESIGGIKNVILSEKDRHLMSLQEYMLLDRDVFGLSA